MPGSASTLRRFAVTALLAAGLTSAAASPAAAGTRAGCGVKNAATQAHAGNTKIAVVRDDADDLYGGYTDVYVCHGKRGKAHHALSLESVWPTFSQWTINGRTAAFVVATFDSACVKYHQPVCGNVINLIAVDARSGAALVETRLPSEPLRVLASRQRGVAWLIQTGDTRELWFARRGLEPGRLATGPAIDPASVVLGAGTLGWSDGGPTTSVPLP